MIYDSVQAPSQHRPQSNRTHAGSEHSKVVLVVLSHQLKLAKNGYKKGGSGLAGSHWKSSQTGRFSNLATVVVSRTQPTLPQSHFWQ